MRDYDFGNFLREIRIKKGLTQHQLGALLGVSDKAVSKWENGTSKPRSNILHKLCDILDISVDQLLSPEYRSKRESVPDGVFAHVGELWGNAYRLMQKRYAGAVPLEMLNRFLSEQAQMQSSYMIVYIDFLSHIVREAKRQNEQIMIRGPIGSSFVAYLMGITDVNPLKPHYYCPDCQTVIFSDEAKDCWDLQKRRCACGTKMLSDGHNVPFESCVPHVRRNVSFNILTSPSFFKNIQTISKNYFGNCGVKIVENKDPCVLTVSCLTQKEERSFNFCASEKFKKYKALERATSVAFDGVSFCDKAVLNEFIVGNVEGIFDFENPLIRKMLGLVSPKSFFDLIQLVGLAHGTGTWIDNAEMLVSQGSSVADIIAYREDVFCYVQGKMIDRGLTDIGFAYSIMENATFGTYRKKRLDGNAKKQLEAAGADERFIDSIEKVFYLFPKAQGLAYFKIAATLMWYKLNYPNEFNEIIL